MYYINTEKDKPSSERLLKNIEEMMRKGIRIREVDKVLYDMEEKKDALAEILRQEHGINNPNSFKQIAEHLEEMSESTDVNEKDYILDICYIDGKWKTSKEEMFKLSQMGYEFADLIIEYRKAKKYYDCLKSLVEFSDENGLIHPSVSLAKTNRINYKEPGLMTINKDLLKYVIGPRKEGDLLYSADVKNQEPAILMNILGETDLIDVLKSTEGIYNALFKKVLKPSVTMNVLIDELMENRIYSPRELRDLVTINPNNYMPKKASCKSWFYKGKRVEAVEVFCQGAEADSLDSLEYPEEAVVQLEDGTTEKVKVKWGKVNKKVKTSFEVKGELEGVEVDIQPVDRKEFKTSFLAITYGASKMSICERCKDIDGKIVYDNIAQMPKMKEYRNNCAKAANLGIQRLNTYFGTKVYADKYGGKQELKRSLLSIPVQGTGADILDLWVDHFEKEAEKKFGEDRPFVYFTRNDELVIETSSANVEKLGKEEFEKWLKDVCEHQIDNWVPFMVEIEPIINGDVNDLLRRDSEEDE